MRPWYRTQITVAICQGSRSVHRVCQRQMHRCLHIRVHDECTITIVRESCLRWEYPGDNSGDKPGDKLLLLRGLPACTVPAMPEQIQVACGHGSPEFVKVPYGYG